MIRKPATSALQVFQITRALSFRSNKLVNDLANSFLDKIGWAPTSEKINRFKGCALGSGTASRQRSRRLLGSRRSVAGVALSRDCR